MRKIITLFSLVLFLFTCAFAQSPSAVELTDADMQKLTAMPESGDVDRSVLNSNTGQRGTDTIANPMEYAGGARVCETTASDGMDYRYITYGNNHGYTFGTGASIREDMSGTKTDSIVNEEIGMPIKNCGISTVDGMGFIASRIVGLGVGTGKIWGNIYSDPDGTTWLDSTTHITVADIDTNFGLTWLEFDPPITVSGDFMLSLMTQPTVGGDTFAMLSTGFGCGADSNFTRPRIRVTSYDPALGSMAPRGSGTTVMWDSTWVVFPNPNEVVVYISCDKSVTDQVSDDAANLDAMNNANASIDVNILNNDNMCDVTDFFFLSSPTRAWFRGDDFITVTQPTSGTATSLVLDNGQTTYSTFSAVDGTDDYTYTLNNPLENAALTATVTINTSNAPNSIDEEELNNSVNFYPNPVVSEINFDIDLSEASDVTIEIYNVIGENLIAEDYTNVRNDKLSVDMSSYSEGAYFANITVDGATITKKFVVSK